MIVQVQSTLGCWFLVYPGDTHHGPTPSDDVQALIGKIRCADRDAADLGCGTADPGPGHLQSGLVTAIGKRAVLRTSAGLDPVPANDHGGDTRWAGGEESWRQAVAG